MITKSGKIIFEYYEYYLKAFIFHLIDEIHQK